MRKKRLNNAASGVLKHALRRASPRKRMLCRMGEDFPNAAEKMRLRGFVF